MKNTHYIFLLAFMSVCVGMRAQVDTARSKALQEVVVTGTRVASDVRHLPMTVTVVENDPLARSNALPALMEQVPGLMLTSRGMMGFGVSTGGSGALSLRGLSAASGQMMVLVDGHPQYNGIFGHAVSDSYNQAFIDRVEVLRGPASLIYGSNAMGGVLNMVTRQRRANGSQTHIDLGYGTYNTLQANIVSQMRRDRASLTVAVHNGRSDNHRARMGFEQYGGYLKGGYDLSDFWTVSADIDLNHFNASNPGTVMQPKLENDQGITRGAASLRLRNDYRYTSGELSVYANFGWHTINDGYVPANNESPKSDLFRSKDALAGISLWQSLKVWDGGQLTAGVDYQHIYGHAWYTDWATDTVVTSPKRLMQSANANENELAGYVTLRQEIAPWLTADGGVRYDYHTVAGGEWVPQLGLVARPVEGGEVKLSAAKGFRNPTMKEMYMYGMANHDSLYAERMWNYELAWHQRLMDGRLSYGVNLFVINGDNMIEAVASKNMNSGAFSNRGIEVEASWRVNDHWMVSTNHSYLKMDRPVIAAPAYKGYLGLQWACGRWSAAAGLQPVGDLYTAVGDEESKESFVLLNALLRYRVIDDVSLWLRGENLLNQTYEINLGYPMPGATIMIGCSATL